MTFRAKPAVQKKHRPAYEADHRRTLLLNIGFGLVVLVALLILAGAGVASWYGDHLANLAVVNGQGISKDDFRDRVKVETFRLDYQETRIRGRMQDGKLSDSAGSAALQTLTSARQTLDTDTMDKLIDGTLQAQLATQQGITVSDQQINDVLTKESTTPESRHLWVIGIKPKTSGTETAPSDQEKAAAKATADQALADLKAGKAWADVAKTMPDDVYSSKDGDAGWSTKDAGVIDQTLVDALFALPVNGVTDVVEGSDGMFRIGRVTEIDPQATDQAFQQKIKDAGISLDSYKKAARSEAIQQALSDSIVASVVNQPTPQRHVAEIFLKLDSTRQAGSGDEVQVRHILFSPNHDPQAASTLDPKDPAWAKAQQDAQAEFELLTKDPSKFSDEAKAKSDDSGTKADGGLLPYYTKVELDAAFANAIFADGLQKNQIIGPVKSAYGWHVIQFLDRRKQPADRMKDIVSQASQPGADFAALAKQYSEDTVSKDNGGDVGWIARNQLDAARELAIFKAAVGGLTDPITESDGIYLYKVLEEQTRQPDASQVTTLKANAFGNWYTAKKNEAQIERLYATSNTSLPAVQ